MARTKQAKKGGRPPIIASSEEFDTLVEEYRTLCTEQKIPVTFTGMALHLGFASRRSFYDYEKREGFSHSVKRARMLVEAEYERRLHGNNVAGAIFALKNHGWSDRQEHAHSRTDSGLSQLSDDELRELLQKRIADITSRLRASGAAQGGNGRAGQGA